MGWRFRRSIGIGPGTRLNIGSKSVGISTGRSGLRISTNSRTGTHGSVGIPGTGLSYRQRLGKPPSNNDATSNGAALWGCLGIWMLISPGSLGCVTLLLFIGALIALSFIVSAVTYAVQVVFALMLAFSPLLLTLLLAAIVLRFDLVKPHLRATTATTMLIAGLVITIGLWHFAPACFG